MESPSSATSDTIPSPIEQSSLDTESSQTIPQPVETEKKDDVPVEEQCLWLPRVLEADPYLLALREKALPFTGGLSFSNMVHTALTASPSVFNRYAILELIYNHFMSIGMYKTAEILSRETGLTFQVLNEPMERTGIRILTSLGIFPHEDMWTADSKTNTVFLKEELEEDSFASPYREDPRTVYRELLDDDFNARFNCEEHTFKHLKECSLNRLIAMITTVNFNDRENTFNFKEDDLHMIFLTLPSITSSEHFLEHLISVFELDFSDDRARTDIIAKYPNIRLNTVNVILKWIKFHGLFIGQRTLKLIKKFAEDGIKKGEEETEDGKWKEYVEVFNEILSMLPQLRFGQIIENPVVKKGPIVKDPQMMLSPNLELLNPEVVSTPEGGMNREKDPDPKEVARQITLLYYQAFSEIHAREFMLSLENKTVSIQTPSLSQFFNLSDKVERVTLEAIAKAPKPVEAVKQVYLIAEELDKLGNYDALSRVIAALIIPDLNTVIKRARIEEQIQKLLTHTGATETTLEWYRQNLEVRFGESLPTIPNITSEIIFSPVISGPSLCESGLINWEKRSQIGKIITTFYKFQNSQYGYWPVPQIQKLILKGGTLTDRELGQMITKKTKHKN